MPVRFVIGRAGAGKTHHCLQAVAAALNDADDPRRLILLVPEQASFQMERALVERAAAGGYWRAEVLSFTRLASRLFEESGGEPVLLRQGARAMALRRVAAEAAAGNGASAEARPEGRGSATSEPSPEPRPSGREQSVFGRAARTPGFFASLDRMIEELIAENVTPAQLADASRRVTDERTRDKLAAVAEVYGRYLDWLGEERLDAAMHLAVLRERIGGVPWLSRAAIWVDGFAGFTGQEFATLVALARCAGEMTITLLMDPASEALRQPRSPGDPLALFDRTEQTYRRLVAELEAAKVKIAPPLLLHPSPLPRFTAAAPLAQLEQQFATPIRAASDASERSQPSRDRKGAGLIAGNAPHPQTARPAPAASPDAVRIVECPTHRDELREAARAIRRLIAESNGRLRFRDFAVIARDLEPFADLVAEVFDAYGIPCFLDRRRPMAVHPLCRFVESLLEAARDDLPPRAMGRLLRTGLTPLMRHDAEWLENLLLRLEFRGAHNWRRPTWDPEDKLPARLESLSRPRRQSDESQERARRRAADLDRKRLSLFTAIEPLLALAGGDVPPIGRAWAATLLAALKQLKAPRRLEAWIRMAQRERDWETAETHRLAWEALCNVLDDLHDVLGDVPVSIEELQQTVAAALGELTLGLAPPTLDQVLVSSIERSRHPEIKHAWVFAFNEGVFPAPPAEDVLLSTAERRRIAEVGLAAPAAHRDDVFGERLLAYIAFSRPSESLTISFATSDDDGGPLQPSLLLDDVRSALPEIEVQRPERFAPPVCVEELANDYLDAKGADVIDEHVRARYRRLVTRTRENLHLQSRLDWLLRGERWDNRPPPLRDPALSYAGPPQDPAVGWSTTPSEIETYVQCPFKHFALYRLKLEYRTPLPMVWEMGNVAHELLADIFRSAAAAAAEPRIRMRDLSDSQWSALIGETNRRFAAIQPDDLAERNPRLAFMIRSTQRFVAEVVMAHVHRMRRSDFEPAAFELYFGPPKSSQDASPAIPGSPGSAASAREQPQGAGGHLPAASIPLAGGGRIEVRGKIDRVDRCRLDGEDVLLVYDYKTIAMPMTLDFLTSHRLALFTYMLAQESHAGARVTGGLIAPWRPDAKCFEAAYVASAGAAEQLMYLYRPRGALEQEIAKQLDTLLAPGPHSPVAMIKLNRDGAYSRQGDLHPGATIAGGIELARRTLLQAAEGVLGGRIVPSPLVENDRLACNMCDCQPLCRFERSANDPRDAASHLPTLAALEREREAAKASGRRGAMAAQDKSTVKARKPRT